MINLKISKITLISFIILLCTNNGFCCTCLDKNTFKKSVKRTDLIFIGKQVDKKEIKVFDDGIIKLYDYKYTFLIEKLIKGQLKSKFITFYSNSDPDQCGISLNGNRAILYLNFEAKESNFDYKESFFYTTNSCSRTTVNIDIEKKKYKSLKKSFVRRNKIYIP